MSSCRRGGHQASAWWLSVLALLLGVSPVASQATGGAPDTVPVVNHAHVSYRVDGSDAAGEASGTATVRLARRIGVVLDSTYDVRIAPGAERVLAHRLRNLGEVADDFVLSAAAPAGWTVSLVRDADGDGRVGAGELPVSAPVRLAPGESAGLLAVVTAPFGAAPGTQAAVFVRAVSASNPSLSAEARNVLTIQASAARLTVVKTVDRATATGGDTLSYSISFSNNGDGATGAVVLEDSLPAGLRIVPGSLALNGASLSDADDGDAGRVARDVVSMSLGTLAAGQGGTATFRSVVAPNLAPGTLSNVAVLRDGTGRVASAPAFTAVELPALRLSKERLGADTVRAGGEVSFRLRYGNLSTRFAVRAVELVDSLPNGLTFVSSDRPSTVDGQVVRWSLGDLAAGDSGVVTIVARVTANPSDGAATLLNRAVVSAANATAVAAAAAPLQVTPYGRDDLKLTKSAGVLEVAIGDAIPYTIVLQNRGAAPLHDVVLVDHLPEGTRLIQRVVEGVDSMRVDGRTVRFFVAGPIAAASSRTVRYAVLVMSPGRSRVLVNRASAIAQNGEVRTAEDSAVVRMRRPAGLQVQALIGKVWLDRNANGRQERGEEGVRGMEVVSADGQLVTTDAEGRFTFPEMAAGVHLVRLDMLRVPEGFAIARAGDDQIVIRADGWTIPRVNFRLVPVRGATTAAATPARDTASIVSAPLALQPAPATAQPTPVVAQPTTTVAQPTPAVAQPAPVIAQPSPAIVQPAAVIAQPAPQPAPAAAAVAPQPASVVIAPAPVVKSAPATRDTAARVVRRSMRVRKHQPQPLAADVVRVDAPVAAPVLAPPVAASATPAVQVAATTITALGNAPAAMPITAPAATPNTAPAATPNTAPAATPAVTTNTAPATARGADAVQTFAATAASARAAGPAAPASDVSTTRTVLAPSDSLPTIAPLRTAEERRADTEREFLVGPAVRFMAPADGSVFATNRIAVIVQGEPGAGLRLFRGDSLLAEGSFRPDGRAEFAGVDLTRGPNRLRVEMTNSWNQARWDSVGLHYSGEPARIELAEMASLRADARDTARVMALVRDEWGVPVAGQPMVTVALGGAKLLGMDADQRAMGFQARAARNGVLALNVAPEHDPGLGSLTLTARKARARIPVRVLPADRALTATGIGQVGVGAAPGSFGAVLMRGALGEETFVTLSYDSRRNGSRDPYFQRGYDPLDESHYPTYGDASERRVFSGATQTFSAKLQHRYDWVELGDVTVDFGDRRLAGYQRSLSGVSSRVERGLVTVKSFGSITDQTLVQRQIRGEGTSGPYRLGLGIRPGTERLAVEVRARDNAARLMQRQELARGFDYQIDYASGEVILQRAIGTVDAGGNPIFLVGTMELRSGGESRFVGGMRMEMDASRLVRRGAMDSLGVAVFGVHDGAAGGAATGSSALLGGDMKLRFGGFSVGTAVMRSSSPDSSALAGRALASWENTDGRFRAEGEWLRVGQGFTNAADPRLSSGLQEIRLAGTVRLNQGSLVTLSHERQRFDQYGVERHNTLAEVQQNIGGRPFSASGGLTTDMKLEPSLASSSLAVGRMSFAPTDRLRVWTEANRNLAGSGDATAVRPDQLAAGVSYRIFPTVSVEGSHRWLKMGGDSVVYGVSGVNLRMESLLGGQVWGGIERPDNRAGHAMVLGWNQKVALTGGWAATSLFERRFGVEQAPLADPTRALPFVGTEQSHWSTSLRLDYLPGAAKARFSTLGEVRDAGASRSMRLEVAGDLPLGRSVAMLGRSNWWRQQVELPEGTGIGRRDRSLFGLALRPAGSDAVNALVRMEWRRNADAAVGGVLGARGEDTRMIGSTDLVWSARPGTEVTGRYALRWTLADAMLPGYTSLGTQSHFAGTRVDQALHGPLSARMDARLLAVGEDRATFWNLAPSAVLRVARQIDVEGGYRFGNLMDPDFGAQGGKGWFATLGFHFTEGTLGTAADFWRERLFNDR